VTTDEHAAQMTVEDRTGAFEVTAVDGYSRVTGEFWTAQQRQMHSLHYAVSYRASFKPELPDYFIRRYCHDPQQDIVFDPFSGRGTTALQANLLGFRCFANDVNALSERIAAPKTCPVSVAAVATRLEQIDLEQENDDGHFDAFSMFYHSHTYRELLNLRDYLRAHRDDTDRFIEMVALSRLHGHSSGFFSVYSFPQISVPGAAQAKINRDRNQSPDHRPLKPRILRKAKAILKDLSGEQLIRLREVGRQNLFTTRDARHIPELPGGSAALLVTSPPFLNKADYLLDNWLEFWFLGIDPEPLRDQVVQTPHLEEWSTFIGAVLREAHRIVRPGGHAVIEVGEVAHRGRRVDLDEVVAELGKAAGFRVQEVLIHQQQFTKLANCFNVTNNEKGTNTNRLVVLEKGRR
jgi:SAM-dependent methyltransferase